MTKYVIDVRFKTKVERSPRILEIAEAFGIGLEDKEFVIFDNLELEINQGDIVYITGQSGAGKSVLLRELEAQMRKQGLTVANIQDVLFEDKPLIEQIGKDNYDGQRIMSLAGLSDAYLWVRKPHELSDGQRYRFRLAKAIEQGANVWVADEFLAVLDRTSAISIAYSVQKTARSEGVNATVLVATTHKDMVEDLDPDIYIEKRFREKIAMRIKNDAK